ncbi:hypothetical protein JI435_407250 [Parastagonospora nodorum SN15]|uniref:Uncharacterized protein n=1 Tax=Phaeosphaeria nodorum (strain SN15 / ATCC MYA-4574 / FGSC 10173) TaxID=321614 RepID=A0A7U2F2C7_PHANO|nr:hypothetical protein JI435_407250 [Parastagonospora nodorum SN15]
MRRICSLADLCTCVQRDFVIGTQHGARVARYSFSDDPSSRRPPDQ